MQCFISWQKLTYLCPCQMAACARWQVNQYYTCRWPRHKSLDKFPEALKVGFGAVKGHSHFLRAKTDVRSSVWNCILPCLSNGRIRFLKCPSMSCWRHLAFSCLPHDSRSPSNILLVRARLFYARPRLVPHTNQIIVGLPENRQPPACVLPLVTLTVPLRCTKFG